MAERLATPTLANGNTETITTIASIDAIEMSPRLELIKNMRRMMKSMQKFFRHQTNTSYEVKAGESKMAELLDVTLNYRRLYKAAEDVRALSNLRKDTVTQPTAATPLQRQTRS